MIENEKKIKELEEEKRLIEEDFLQKKTKFKEMYYSRESMFVFVMKINIKNFILLVLLNLK